MRKSGERPRTVARTRLDGAVRDLVGEGGRVRACWRGKDFGDGGGQAFVGGFDPALVDIALAAHWFRELDIDLALVGARRTISDRCTFWAWPRALLTLGRALFDPGVTRGDKLLDHVEVFIADAIVERWIKDGRGLAGHALCFVQ